MSNWFVKLRDPNWIRNVFNNQEDKYLVLGPSGSGKTYLISSLLTASRVESRTFLDAGINLKVDWLDLPANHDFMLWEDYLLEDGFAPVNQTTQKIVYRFKITGVFDGPLANDAMPQWMKELLQHHAIMSFAVPDGPGGDGFPQSRTEPFHEYVADNVKLSNGVIYCIDPQQTRNPSLFKRHFNELLNRGISLPHVVFAITHSDAMFAQYGVSAESEMERVAPERQLYNMLGELVVDRLRQLNPKSVSAVWTSVFGFLPNGSPNFDPKINNNQGGLCYCEANGKSGKEASASWRPSNVLNPFLHITFKGAPDVQKIKL
jgi:GTPase SAR1 family protein